MKPCATRTILAFLAAAALAAAGGFLPLGDWTREALARVRGLGAAGPAAFVGIYVLAAILCLPGSILTLGAGAVFGLRVGFVAASIGATAGAAAAFGIGRHLARARVARAVEGNPRFKAIDEAVGAQGWKIVLLTRLSPVFPFNLLNYAFGLTRVPFRDYLWASWLGMLPGAAVYVYLGSLAGSLAAATGGAARKRAPIEWALYGVGFAATVAAAAVVSRTARQALRRAAPEALSPVARSKEDPR